MGLSIDEQADETQREALQMIFGGQVGGFSAEFAEGIGEVRGVEFAPPEFEIADDLTYWRAEIPGKAITRAEALTGPMTPPGQLVQPHNPPGSEVGPSGTVATWGGRRPTALKPLDGTSSGTASVANTSASSGAARNYIPPRCARERGPTLPYPTRRAAPGSLGPPGLGRGTGRRPCHVSILTPPLLRASGASKSWARIKVILGGRG